MNKLLFILFIILPSVLLAQSPNAPVSNASITPIDTTQTEPVKPPQSKDIDPTTGLNTGYYIGDNLSMVKGFSQFYKLMDAAGLTETFRSRGPITIFVPDDLALAKLSAAKTDSLLMHNNLPQLIALVSYHAIPGKLTLAKIAKQIDGKTGLATFTTLSGGKLYAKYDGNRNLILVDETGHQAIVTRDGIKQHNGLFNIIDTVLQPKNKL
jgi:uncharacterized surface protein with fasciclin (FAS1) repeats